MLNVKAVQDNLSSDYKKALGIWSKLKDKSKLDWQTKSTIEKPWNGACLPRTCSAIEIAQPHTKAALADLIAAKLKSKNKYIQCCSTTTTSNEILEEFGFTQATKYKGKNGAMVYVYFLNLTGYTF